jgi:hypothetical protein
MTAVPSARPTDGPRRVADYSRLLLGLVVIAFGVVFLLDSAGVLDADRTIDRWWPLLLVAAGVLTLAERPPSPVRGMLLTGAGVVLLLFSTDVVEGDAGSYLWPVLLVLVGITVVARWSGRIPFGERATEDDVIRSTVVFGGAKLAATSQSFSGAAMTAVFGGATLDLRGARPVAGGAAIDATTAFGGIDILVPHGWQISVRGMPIFGGIEDKTDHAEASADAPVLHVDAVSVFGGVDIKHGK